jgi:hypothetical protein
MTKIAAALVAFLVVAVAPVARAAPSAQAAATCSDYSTQAEAQRAGDTRDADGDGIYCESLPCPCSTAAPGSAKPPSPPKKPASGDPKNCTTPSGVQNHQLQRDQIRQHPRALPRGREEGLAQETRPQPPRRV